MSSKVGDTINAVTTPENATNVVSYKWELLDEALATTGTEVGSATSLPVTADMKGKFVKLTITMRLSCRAFVLV